jgi:hypothetical protein
MKNINTGPEFLNLVFKDMKDSIKSDAKDPSRKIAEYLERIEKLHGKALSDEHKRDVLKSFYYSKYVIKSLPESYVKYRKGFCHDLGLVDKKELTPEDKGLVLGCIKYEQRKSLDNWLDYLFDENNTYPTWFKYYIFQGVTKVGTYYPMLRDFTKRSSSTTDPFIPVDQEMIGKMYNLVSKYLGDEPLTEEEQEITSTGLNFRNVYSKLYRSPLARNKNIIEDDLPEHIGPAVPDYDASDSSANVYANHPKDEDGVHIGSAIPDYQSSGYDIDSIPQEDDGILRPPFEEEVSLSKK